MLGAEAAMGHILRGYEIEKMETKRTGMCAPSHVEPCRSIVYSYYQYQATAAAWRIPPVVPPINY
jgi:hypothetical protein